MTFENLNLIPTLLRGLSDKGYTTPTPIQVQAIPPALEGRDVLGCAQTGTGKTAAFALPILQRLWKAEHARGPRPVLALVLCPTRELATQIGDSFRAYGKHSGLTSVVIFGGVGYDKQRRSLAQGVDILVATPGRLLDLMRERSVRFDRLQVLVLDEADRMLDLGFLPDVERILSALPAKRQTLCFSATMPPPIRKLVDRMLHDPVRVAVTPSATTVQKVEQAVFFVDKTRRADVLLELLRRPDVTRALVFTRTKRGANRLAARLSHAGVSAEAIHGNKTQNARERALATFKSARGRVLVATDIAARGIDVNGISHVINFELPNEPETYVHRIGRTARAAASGVAWSFCSGEERAFLRDIERLIRQSIPVGDGPRGAEREASRENGDAGARRERPSRSASNGAAHAKRAPKTTRAPHTEASTAPVRAREPQAPAPGPGFGAGVSEEAERARRAAKRRHPAAPGPRTPGARAPEQPARNGSQRKYGGSKRVGYGSRRGAGRTPQRVDG